MAIAPLSQQEQFELLEIPWPKPNLRLVRTSTPDLETPVSRTAQVALETSTDYMLAGERGVRRTHARTVVRRRRLLVCLLVGMAMVLLSLPVQFLGGQTSTGQVALSGVTSGLPDGSIYIVQSGDTLSSIAHRINPMGDQAVLVRALRTTVGSSGVVPGEHIVLP